MATLFGGYTEFDNLFSGLNEHESGTFQIEGNAEGFRYSKTLLSNLPTVSKVLRDDWLIELRESDATNAKVLFRQRVNFGINIVAAPGVFIAYPNENEQIETTIINGVSIDPQKAIEFLDLNYQSEFGITRDFTASPGVGGGEVSGIWESLPYRQEVYPGMVFKIIHDGWKPVGLSKVATYKVSYKPATPYFSSLYDEAGALRSATNATGRVDLVHTYSSASLFTRRAALQGLREPTIFKDETNKLWIGAVQDNVYRFFESYDDGRSIRPVQYWSSDEPSKKINVEILDNTFKYPRSWRLASGNWIAWGLKGGGLWVKVSTSSAFVGTPRRVASVPRTEPYSINEDKRTGTFWLTNGRDVLLESIDGGIELKPVS